MIRRWKDLPFRMSLVERLILQGIGRKARGKEVADSLVGLDAGENPRVIERGEPLDQAELRFVDQGDSPACRPLQLY